MTTFSSFCGVEFVPASPPLTLPFKLTTPAFHALRDVV
jgi:hypothetical protein